MINRVSVRPPQFNKEKPHIWFIQMEAQFATNGITQDQTKFYHAVQALDSDVLGEVSSVIVDPPTTNKYETLKDKILAEFRDSEEKRLRKLLTHTDLGDQRPSRLLKRMHDLAEGKVNDNVIKSLWLQRLPTNIQTVLSTSEDPLEKLASMADKIHDIVAPSVNAVITVPPPSTTSQLDEIIRRLGRLESGSRDRSSQRQAKGNKGKPHSRSASPRRDICWYHRRFKKKATKCTAPCGWVNQESKEN